MEQTIRAYLKETKVVGKEIRCFDELESTNTYARKLALSDAPEGTVVIADSQTGGRGRMGRSFQSPRGKGLYLTALLRPALPLQRLLPVTTLAGVAVSSAVESVCGVRPGLKWPNDLVLGTKKLCGILAELVMDERERPCVILGIGVNVSQTAADFTPDVAEIAVSAEAAVGRPVSRPALAAAVIWELDRLYAALKDGDLSEYLARYRRDCVNLGKTVQLIGPGGQCETAVAEDIDEEFGLLVRMSDGTEQVIRSGEVSVRGLYGYIE